MSAWREFIGWLQTQPALWLVTTSMALLLAAWLADFVTKRVLLRALTALARLTPTRWDDALFERGVVGRVAHVVPALVIYFGIALLPGIEPDIEAAIGHLAVAYIVFTLAHAITRSLSLLNQMYLAADAERAKHRPIKGYIQLLQLLVWLVTAVLIIAVLINRSPLLLLSGLGAMTAVLLLVFKDTLMGLTASIQLTSQDMLRVGDWIEMPSANADGDVIDIALHTVKVQNWDKSITSIPTHRLISESFRNWRGMSEAGGRRIKRALLLDQRSVRFLRDEERGRLKRFALIEDYLQRKQDEIGRWNDSLRDAALEAVNTRRLTNLGTFRAYVDAYLRHHAGLHKDMTVLVRQLAPTPSGMPLELYCFTQSTDWNVYEATQADIFDHLLAILPEFDLQLFQSPSGGDFKTLLKAGS